MQYLFFELPQSNVENYYVSVCSVLRIKTKTKKSRLSCTTDCHSRGPKPVGTSTIT